MSAVTVRSALAADGHDAAALVNAETSSWVAWPPTTGDALRRWWEAHGEHRRALFHVAERNGELVGYGALIPSQPGVAWFELWDVDAAAGEKLLATLERSARARENSVFVLRAQVEEGRARLTALVEARHYRPVRTAITAVKGLSDPPPVPRWPDGIHVRTFSRQDVRTVFELETETLTENWESTAETFENWRQVLDAPEFDPTLWWIAESTSGPAGFLRARKVSARGGWLDAVGIDPAWRRRGLARALTTHALGELRARGLAEVGVGTDGANLTGARSLVEQLGFDVAQTFVTYEKTLRGKRRGLGSTVRRVRRRVRAAARG